MRDFAAALVLAGFGLTLNLTDSYLFANYPASLWSEGVSRVNNNVLPDLISWRSGSVLMFAGIVLAGVLYATGR